MTALQPDTRASAYAGDVSPVEAWQRLADNARAMLVDVRTPPEWMFSGAPDLHAVGKAPVLLSWRLYPDFTQNLQFTGQLSARIPEKDTPLYFLCKTVGRSREAALAMAALGYTRCYNIQNGFEGDANPQGQRGKTNGWKAEGLAWVQS